MESIRKWFYRPKKDDTSLLAQFFYANEALTTVACELDSFDGRQEPERCTTLVNQLRHCQDKVLTICNQIMDELIPDNRANRDFRVKFPDDVMQENLAGQLWFGAECLAAGSSIMNREVESSAMRPLAKALTKSLETVRNLLREHALKGHMNLKELVQAHNPLELEKLIESLKIFDRLFADFELCYVAAMVPVKTTKEYEQQELVCVLFSETLQRALERGLLNQIDVDNYEPALMFTIPRLAIVSGLLAPAGGPLCLNSIDSISEMFRPFRNLLLKIREHLWTLNNRELYMLEKLLCSNEEPNVNNISNTTKTICQHDLEEFVHNFYTDYPNCKEFIADFYTISNNTGTNMDEIANDAVQLMKHDDDNNERLDRQMKSKLQPERDKNKKRKQKKQKKGSASTAKLNSQKYYDKHQQQQQQQHQQQHDQINSSSNVSSVLNYNDDTSNNGLLLTDNNVTPLNDDDYDNPGCSGTINTSENKNDNIFTSGISQMLNTSDNIEIPHQTQYLLNQVSHENNVTNSIDPIQIENSLPDIDSKKLISETNKTLSNLLLDGGECPNELSEQTDSGICTVISSENTSLYDKSPEEKKTFANEINEDRKIDEENRNDKEYDSVEDGASNVIINAESNEKLYIKSYSDSQIINNDNNDSDSDINKCVKLNTNNNSIESTSSSSKLSCNISSNFNGTNEEFVGLAYGNGHITVCDSNPINYSDNWENINVNIDINKYKNCPSTSNDISISKIDHSTPTIVDKNISHNHNERMLIRKSKDLKLKKYRQQQQQQLHHHHHHHHRKLDKNKISSSKKANDDEHSINNIPNQSFSTESSRSNSTDRCLNPRLTNFGGSLHPANNSNNNNSSSNNNNNNTRQLPNFGSPSSFSQRHPHFCHFESIPTTDSNSTNIQRSNFYHHRTSQNCKLFDKRRSRSEHNNDKIDNNDFKKFHDGLGRRTDKNGLVNEQHSKSPKSSHHKSKRISSRLNSSSSSSNNTATIISTPLPSPYTLDPQQSNTITNSTTGTTTTCSNSISTTIHQTNYAASNSSYSSGYDDSSSETSEFQSDCQDDEEIALAMQAAEIANRNQIRSKFRSSEDLVHRLFVCIAGVADQLQTNFASDLRNILKCVFLMNSSQVDNSQVEQISPSPSERDIHSTQLLNTNNNLERQNSLQEEDDDEEEDDDDDDDDDEEDDDNNENKTTSTTQPMSPITERGEECVERAPAWIPDNDAPRCMACQAGFTVVRRRHHCRNCGKVFCGRCSNNNVPLPRYGHTKPVRVCNRCFLYQVTPFTVTHVSRTT